MCNLMQRILRRRDSSASPPAPQVLPDPGILAITADLGFYSCILNAACSWGWTAEWASSMNRGLNLCATKMIRIVIFDRDLPDVDWRYAFDRLSATGSAARIVLAAPDVDEELWQTVLHKRGYDVIARSANSEQLRRELRFAWLSLSEQESPEQTEMAAPVLSGG